MKRCCSTIGLPILGIAAFVLIWQAVAFFVSQQNFFPSPVDVMRAISELYRSGVLVSSILASLERVFIGLVAACLLAIPLGFVLGRSKPLEHAVNPLVQFGRTVSPIAWIPLAILWFGIGDIPAVFIIFITTFYPLLVNTIHAVQTIDPEIMRVAVHFGAAKTVLARRVLFPAALPHIFLGVRIAAALAWVIIVAAEMVGMRSGLGFMILDARNLLRTDMVVAGMVVIGVIGYCIDWLMRAGYTAYVKNYRGGSA